MKSTRKHKKYMVYVKANNKRGYKIVHFGDNRYKQFKDKTPLKLYKHLDHQDKERKKRYYARHGKAIKDSAKYFSHKYLW
tara:strand:- start:8389 stop:8628 length:240 start_codon:yes stop_codon:yes gene_type:complete